MTDDKPDNLGTPGDGATDAQKAGGVTTPPAPAPTFPAPQIGERTNSAETRQPLRSREKERKGQGPTEIKDINLPTIPSIGTTRTQKVSIPLERERAAKDIAKWLITAFTLSMVGAFIIVMALIVPTWWADTDTVITKVMPAMNSILEAVKLIGAIFSPLLAFILGYYFSVSTHKDDD